MLQLLQLLKSWGADVTVTCSSAAVDLLTDLGVDATVDYQSNNYQNELERLPR